MDLPKWTLVEAHVDWLTATSPTGPGAIELFDLGARILAANVEKGNTSRTTSFEGYHGTFSEGCFIGYRTDGCCIRLGGQLARYWWRDVARKASNISRLDLAITATCEPDNPEYPGQVWDSLPDKPRRGGRPAEYSLIQSRYGGQTLYCGRRASEHFGRIYDKHRESKGQYPPGTFRFEVEYKGQAAKEVAAYLKEQADSEYRIVGVVRRRLGDWGVTLPVSDPSWDWRETPIIVRTTNESRYKWLKEQVSITVEKLSTTYSAADIREALGLKAGTIDAYGEDDPRRRYFEDRREAIDANEGAG